MLEANVDEHEIDLLVDGVWSLADQRIHSWRRDQERSQPTPNGSFLTRRTT